MSATDPAAARRAADPSTDGASGASPPSDAGSAVSHARPISESAAPPSAPPPSSRLGAVSLAPASRTTLPPRSSAMPRPMTMPPMEGPPELDDLAEDALTAALRSPRTASIPPPGSVRAPELREPASRDVRSSPPGDVGQPPPRELRVRGVPVRALPEAALGGHAGMFARPRGRNLLSRTTDYHEWYKARSGAGLWPYSRRFDGPLDPIARTRAEDGRLQEGLNFAAHDYLSLSTHPAVHEAAHKALRDYGPIASGSPILAGNTPQSRELEEEVGKLLGLPSVLLFTTGWAAGFSAVTALVREHDHIVMDVYSHASLQQGAMSATRKISRFRHCDNVSAERQIRKARAADAEGGILVITETVFSMDSDSPRLAELQEICRRYDATLLVDCAHDLGCMGPGGAGRLGLEGLVGDVDLVTGCFSKTFATNGGFFAARDPNVRQYVRAFGGPHLFSAAPSPVQTAVALAAMRISASPEGDQLRENMLRACVALREELTSRALEVLGDPSSLVPVFLGDDAVARVTSALCFERGLLCNLIEYPAVAVGMSRVRLQMQSRHTAEHARTAARILHECLAEAEESGVSSPQPRASE